MNGFNTVFMSHFDTYLISYKNFSPVKPDPSIFNIGGNKLFNFLKYDNLKT